VRCQYWRIEYERREEEGLEAVLNCGVGDGWYLQQCMENGAFAMEEWFEGFVSRRWIGPRKLQIVMVVDLL
jgi:hypothetical protein